MSTVKDWAVDTDVLGMFKRQASEHDPTKMVPKPAALVTDRYRELERCYVMLRPSNDDPSDTLRATCYVIYDPEDAKNVLAFLDGDLDEFYELSTSGTELRKIVISQCEEVFANVVNAESAPGSNSS